MILGFYSATADQEAGHTVWTTPSGNHVLVTRFCNAGKPLYRAGPADEVERGEIIALARSGIPFTTRVPISVIEPNRPRPVAVYGRSEDDDGA